MIIKTDSCYGVAIGLLLGGLSYYLAPVMKIVIEILCIIFFVVVAFRMSQRKYKIMKVIMSFCISAILLTVALFLGTDGDSSTFRNHTFLEKVLLAGAVTLSFGAIFNFINMEEYEK